MICITCNIETDKIRKGRRSCNSCEYKKRKEKPITLKKCKNCNKETLNFRHSRNTCRECEAFLIKEKRNNNIDESRKKKREYSTIKKEKIIEYRDKQRGGLKQSIRKIVDGKIILIKVCKVCNTEKVKLKENTHRWSCINENCSSKGKKFKYETTSSYKLKKSLSVRLRQLITNKKKGDTVKYLDCSIKQLKKWLEYNFEEGMTWDNYGTIWHLDHIKPCNSYDFKNLEEIEECFNWKNIRPCFAIENLKKANKVIQDVINKYKKIANQFINIINQKEIVLKDLKSKTSLTTTVL